MSVHTWILSGSRGESSGLINEGTAQKLNSVIKVHLYANRTVNKDTIEDISYIRYPFIQPFATDCLTGWWGNWSLSHLPLNKRWWCSLEVSRSDTRWQTTVHTHPWATSSAFPQKGDVYGPWEEVDVPGASPRRHGNMQTPHGKAPRKSNNN